MIAYFSNRNERNDQKKKKKNFVQNRKMSRQKGEKNYYFSRLYKLASIFWHIVYLIRTRAWITRYSVGNFNPAKRRRRRKKRKQSFSFFFSLEYLFCKSTFGISVDGVRDHDIMLRKNILFTYMYIYIENKKNSRAER